MAGDPMPGVNVAARWKKTKEIYERSVGQKKPAEKILKVFRKSTDIENGLKAFDAADTLPNDRGKAEKAVAALSKTQATATASIKTYLQLLEKAIAEDRQADPAYSLGLKLLKADLKAIVDLMANELESQKTAVETWEINTPEQAAALMAKQDKKLIAAMVYGIKHLYAATLKARAQADAAFFNDTIPHAVREGLVEMHPKNLPADTIKGLAPKRPYPQKEIVEVFTYSTEGKARAATNDDVPTHCDVITRDLAVITAWVKSIPGAPGA